LDYLDNPRESVTTRWDRLPVPVIATCRGREQGGKFQGSIEEEVRILQYAVENGAKFIDIDHRFARSVADARGIWSFHDCATTPLARGDARVIPLPARQPIDEADWHCGIACRAFSLSKHSQSGVPFAELGFRVPEISYGRSERLF